jgi:hypothetical protein
MQPGTPLRPFWLVVLVSAVLTLVLGSLGQDANWDLLNYHIYNPAAWLDGRLDSDIAPAQRQSWHNPLADLPLWWLIRAGAGGALVTAWLALPALIALVFALMLLDAWLPTATSAVRSVATLLLATGGAAAVATLGTTFNDWIIAAGVMPALWWVVVSQARRGVLATWLPAGLLVGAVTGLKLTGAPYCAGLAAAALVAGPLRAAPARLMALALGGLLGAAATLGFWSWELWQRFGNPVMPYFNDLFGSTEVAALPFSDLRFRPNTVSEVLSGPVRLLRASQQFSELPLRDPRLLLGLLALAALPGACWRRATESCQSGPATRLLAAFFVTSLALWLWLYGIYRYTVPLELLAMLFVVGALSLRLSRHWLWLALIAVVLVVNRATIRPDWGRQPFRTPMVEVDWPPLPPDSLLVICSADPVAFALPFAPRGLDALSLCNNLRRPSSCDDAQRRASRRINGHTGPLLLLDGPDPARNEDLHALGLRREGECEPLPNSLSRLQLCTLQHVEAAGDRVAAGQCR